MIDHDPPGLGLEEQVDPTVEDLTVLARKLHGMFDQHAAGGEASIEFRPEAPCTRDCVRGRHRSLTRSRADQRRSTLDRRRPGQGSRDSAAIAV